MREWERALTVAASAALAAAAARTAGRAVWARRTAAALARLEDASSERLPSLAPSFAPGDLEGLPAPVARYFVYALTPGQPTVSRCRMSQTGEFAADPGRWAPFEATEHFSVSPPGLLWDARIRMAPGVDVLVRDEYLLGEGSMRGAIEGLLPVVDQGGTPEMATASLLRYLAEAVWFPTALLPGAGVAWEPIDDDSARATLVDSGVQASMTVFFEPTGEIASISALRHRDLGGVPVVTPWEGRFAEYTEREGMMVPEIGEVGWIVAGEWQPYWRGHIEDYEVEYAAATD